MTRTWRLAPFAAAAALVAACSRPSELPDMGVSRTSLSFEAPGGSGDPAAQAVWVTNTGRGALAPPTSDVAYVDGAGWLAATVTGDGAPYRVDVRPTTAGLDPGVYRATVTLACANASASPAQVEVTLTIPDPRFSLSVASLAFVAPSLAGDPAPQSFQVVNAGRGVLPVPDVEISYVGSAGWLSATVSGTPDAYTVTVAAHVLDGMASRIHAATISIGSAGVSGPPRTLGVTLDLAPHLALSSTAVRIDAPADGTAPEAKIVEVTNAGRGEMAPPVATVTSGVEWLTAAIWGTSAPYSLVLYANHRRASLDAGTYSGTVSVATVDGSSAVTVDVTFGVPPAIIHPSSSPVAWDVYGGCPLPGARVVVLSNAGAGRLRTPTATVPADAASWLASAVTPVRDRYELTLTVTSPPPVAAGSSIATSVLLEAPGAEPLALPIAYSAPVPAITATTATPAALAIRAQAGTGDPAPVALAVRTEGGCIAPPTVTVSYAAPGDPAWLSTGIATSIGRHDVLVRASAAGMSAGEQRTATLHVEAAGLSQDVPVTLAVATPSPTGPLATARYAPAVVALPDGRALAIGGRGDSTALASVEVYDPTAGGWTGYAPMTRPRWNHGAVRLDDGRVLVCGGVQDYATPLLTCEATSGGEWSAAGSLQQRHDSPTLVPLPFGRVLVVSGLGRYVGDDGIWAPTDAEILDLETGVSAYATDESGLVRVSGTSAVALPGGEVLVTGGVGGATWLYDPATGRWAPSAPTAEEHIAGALVALPDGRVLCAAGFTPRWDSLYFVYGAETWDPRTGLWTAAGPTPFAHYARDFVLFPSGKAVALTGLIPGGGVRSDVEVLDAETGSWSQVPAFEAPPPFGNVPVRLANGMVLAFGGVQSAEPYGATAEAFIW